MAARNQGGAKLGRVRARAGGGCVPPPSRPPLCGTGGCANGGGVRNGGPGRRANRAGEPRANTRGWAAPRCTKDAAGGQERSGARTIGAHPSPCPSRTNRGARDRCRENGKAPPLCTPIPFSPPKATRGRWAARHPRSGAAAPPPPPVCAQGRHASEGPRGKGVPPPHPLRPAPICTQRGCAQTRPPGSCRDGKRAGGARLTRGSAPSPPHCTQGNRGGVNLEEPPRGVRAGATCEREAAQTQEQPPPPLCMRQGGKRTGGRAQTQRRYPSCLFTRKGNGRARKRGHAGHAHSACPLSIDLDKKSP